MYKETKNLNEIKKFAKTLNTAKTREKNEGRLLAPYPGDEPLVHIGIGY